MLVEYARIATVVIDRDVIGVLLEDHARMGGITAAREVRQTADISGRLRHVLLIMPCGAVLEPEIERPDAGDKPFEVRCSGRKRSIHTAAGLPGDNAAVEHNFAAADCAVLDIEIDASIALYIKRCCVLGSGIYLGMEAFQRHRAVISLHRFAAIRAGDIDFRRAGDIRRAARRQNAPGRLQRNGGSRIVHKELQRLRLDIKRLSGIDDAGALCDTRDPAAVLDRQNAVCGINMNIRTRRDCAAESAHVVLIRDVRVFREAIRAVCLTNIRIDVLLICIRTEETRREFRRRLLRARRRRFHGRCIEIAALTTRRVERDVLKAFACRRCSQTFGNLHLAREAALTACICGVVELVRECVERCAHEILVCCLCGFGIESDIVCRQRDGAASCCIIDAEVAADDRRRRCGVMRVEYLRMTAVIVDRDGVCILLENHACVRGIAAACECCHTAALPRIACLGLLYVRPRCAVLQGEVELPDIMRRESSGTEIIAIDVIGRRSGPRGVVCCESKVQNAFGLIVSQLTAAVLDGLLSVLTGEVDIARDIRLLVSDDTFRAVDVHRSFFGVHCIVVLGQAAVFRRGDGAAADIDEAVCTDRFQCAAFNALDVDIAFDRDRGIVSRRYQRGKIAPVIGDLLLICAVGTYRLNGEIAVDDDLALRPDRAAGLHRGGIVALGVYIFDDDRPVDLEAGVCIGVDSVRSPRVGIRRLDGQRGRGTAVCNFDMFVVADIDCICNLVCAVCLNAQAVPVHIDNHRMLLVIGAVFCIERRDNAVPLRVRLRGKSQTIIGERLRFFDGVCRCQRERGIDIAALSARRVKGDVLEPLARRRSGQTFRDLDLACEVALVCCICGVVQLVRKGVEGCAYEVLVSCAGICARVQPRVVRAKQDAAVCGRLLYRDISAENICRHRCVVAIENGRIAAEVLNGEIAGLSKALFFERSLFSLIPNSGLVVLPEEPVCTGHVDKALIAFEDIDLGGCRLAVFVFLLRRNGIVPDAPVVQRELQVVSHVETGPLRIGAVHCDLHRACCESLPIGTVLHEEIYAALCPRGYTITRGSGVVAKPVGICG